MTWPFCIRMQTIVAKMQHPIDSYTGIHIYDRTGYTILHQDV